MNTNQNKLLSELIVLLPTRNEEVGIGEVISRLPIKSIQSRGYNPRVVVIDGNSIDSTCDIASSMGAEILHQTHSLGKGKGVREALDVLFKEQRKSNDDILVMLDADATYEPEDIPMFIDNLRSHDVIWGSRLRGKIEKGAMSTASRVGNYILSFIASMLFFSKTSDLCTGYWGFRMTALKKLTLSARGFTLEADIFCSTVKSNLRTKEFPVNYKHREGASTLKWYIDGPRIFLMLVRRRFN